MVHILKVLQAGGQLTMIDTCPTNSKNTFQVPGLLPRRLSTIGASFKEKNKSHGETVTVSPFVNAFI